MRLREIYVKARPDYSGRVTVPVLWDKQGGTIVNNESSEIIRMFNSEFGRGGTDFYPAALRADIDAINGRVYETVNNGVYKCGFAQTQEAYEEAFDALFATLDTIEGRLDSKRYLTGARITEADWRLFPTLVRFDAVYFTHFKCNLRRIEDYANLSNYLRELARAISDAGRGHDGEPRSHQALSSATITRATNRSIRGASWPRARPSTLPAHTTALRLAGEALAPAG